LRAAGSYPVFIRVNPRLVTGRLHLRRPFQALVPGKSITSPQAKSTISLAPADMKRRILLSSKMFIAIHQHTDISKAASHLTRAVTARLSLAARERHFRSLYHTRLMALPLGKVSFKPDSDLT
jgi:hypothetical protein